MLRYLTTVAIVGRLVTASSGCSLQGKRSLYLERGKRHFGSGDRDKAEIEYRQVLRIDPQSAPCGTTPWHDLSGAGQSGLGFPIPAQNDRIRVRPSGDPVDVGPRLPLGPPGQKGPGRGDVYTGKAAWQ